MQNVYKFKAVHQMIGAFLVSSILGWMIVFILPGLSISRSFALMGISFLAVLFSFKLVAVLLKKYSITKIILYSFVFSAFLGPGILNLKLGPISIFPYRLLLPVAVIILLYQWFVKDEFFSAGREPLKNIILFYYFWIAYAVLSLLWVLSVSEGIKDIIFLCSGLLFTFLFISLFKEREDYHNLLWLWMAVLLLMVGLGFWNHLTLQHLPISRMYNAPMYIRDRPTAVFTNENDFATYMAISVFIALAFLQFHKSFLLKLLGFALLGTTLYLILVTSSRANLLAVMLAGFFWFILFTSIKQKRYLLLLGSAGFIVVLAVSPAAVTAIFKEVESQILSIFAFTDTGDASMDIRKNLLKNSLIFIANSLGFGIGAGNAETYMKAAGLFPTMGTLNIHNWWAELLVHYGVLIFMGYVLIYLWFMVILYKLFKSAEHWKDRLISQALCTSLIAFSVASISPSSIMTLNFVWILFAIAAGYINARYKKNTEGKEQINE
ncbi:O-antigen ligase family protein [Bacillus sp. J33]|uniref:O-antigen ligase family protein n=1 Tax=Bacillus sp. J33 TaxID=935836 RepID=UPI00047EBA6E|nr:O-antigen ligase family protein [Bacillus sp. J33]